MTNQKYSLIVAITIDGKIAAHPDHMSDWTSKEDKEFLRSILSESEAIVIGNTTYKMYQPALSKRNCIVFSRAVPENNSENKNLTYFNPELQSIEKYIADQKYQSVAILGGTQIYSYFLENNLLTDLYITVEPIIFGQGLDLFKTKNYVEKRFVLRETTTLNSQGSLVLHYQRSV